MTAPHIAQCSATIKTYNRAGVMIASRICKNVAGWACPSCGPVCGTHSTHITADTRLCGRCRSAQAIGVRYGAHR